MVDDGEFNNLIVHGILNNVKLYGTYADKCTLHTWTNSPYPDVNIGYGDGAGGLDTTKEYLRIFGGEIRLINAKVTIPKSGSGGGLVIGGDVHLYRSNANELCIPDDLLLPGGPYNQVMFGDNGYNILIKTDSPTIYFGDGSTTRDVKLYRSAPNTLATDRIFESQEHWQHLNPQQFMDALYNHTFTDTTGKIKFYDLEEDHNYIFLHGVMSDGNPNLVCSQHLAVEKDLVVKGMLDSLEGEVALNGGNYGPGWGPDTRNPFIWLANANYDTLEIRKKVTEGQGDWSYEHQYGQVWGWGDLELGNLTIHGYMKSASGWLTLGSAIQITQAYYTSVTGYGYLNSSGAHGYLGGSTGNVPVSLLTLGRIFCGGEIDVYSDQRDKNLVDALNAQTALSTIMKLNPLHYAWKPETKKGNNVVAGFFAQEVAKVIPEAVTVHEGARYPDEHTLNYNVLTTYALSAIQGLTRKHDEDVAKLTKEIEDLRSEIQ